MYYDLEAIEMAELKKVDESYLLQQRRKLKAVKTSKLKKVAESY